MIDLFHPIETLPDTIPSLSFDAYPLTPRMSVLCVKKLKEEAILPTFDEKLQYVLYAPYDITITPNKPSVIPLGFQMSFPKNYAALLVDCGRAETLGGLIDSDYRGEIGIITSSDIEVKFTRGQAIGRVILIEIAHPLLEDTEIMSSSGSDEECEGSSDK